MTVKQAVLEDLETLPVVKQEEVLDFVQFLKSKQTKSKPRRSLKGSLAPPKHQVDGGRYASGS